jgi:hypothetical protein
MYAKYFSLFIFRRVFFPNTKHRQVLHQLQQQVLLLLRLQLPLFQLLPPQQ